MDECERSHAIKLSKEGHNLLITGQAGTGKTTLVKEIAKTLQSSGKRVAVTCTTGIATTNFPGAQTIHRWAGIGDGRNDSDEITSLILSSPKYASTLANIRQTDTLIIDEVSMLSKRIFNKLEHICSSARGGSLMFGGLQIVLAGDFFQLPPVPNINYNDPGEFCFMSDVFTKVVPHHVNLLTIHRQHDKHFTEIINKVARGNVDNTVRLFMETLNHPVPETAMKLFSMNFLADIHNRNQVLQLEGELVEYNAEDAGEIHMLSKIQAPSKLWIKVGCPVILIKNLTDTLVNGLQGTVRTVTTHGPVVEFPSINVTTVMKKTDFSVFSPDLKKDIAVRTQVPLRLAYALTVHKSQGMTLTSVEVDCRHMFKSGQLGVAIARVQSADNLRVINFHPRVCLPPPDAIQQFMEKSSGEPIDNLSCCQQIRTGTETENFIIEANDDMPDNEVTEEEVEDELRTLIEQSNAEDKPEYMLPESFDIVSILKSCKTENVLTPKQAEVNQLIDHVNIDRVKQFCSSEFSAMTDIIESSNTNEPVPIKAEEITQFYTKFHKRTNSAQYKVNCMTCFDLTKLTNAHWHICYVLTCRVRQHVLESKASMYPSSERNISNRITTDASKARIRYVGGYCLQKVRKSQMTTINTCMYSKSSEGQSSFHRAAAYLHILDSLREEEECLKEKTTDPQSLFDICRKQNINRGLTHISDELYMFFVSLCEECLTMLVDKNLSQEDEIYNFCLKSITSSQSLRELFCSCVSSTNQEAVTMLFELLCKKFLFVMLNQFRKDLLQAFNVAKTMAHRKQIQLRKDKASSTKLILFKTIEDDNTQNKQMSHSLLQGALLGQSFILENFTKAQLLILSKAYDIVVSSKLKKKDIADKLRPKILNSTSMLSLAGFDKQT